MTTFVKKSSHFSSSYFAACNQKNDESSLNFQSKLLAKAKRETEQNKDPFPPEHIASNPNNNTEIPFWTQVNIKLTILYSWRALKSQDTFLIRLKNFLNARN